MMQRALEIAKTPFQSLAQQVITDYTNEVRSIPAVERVYCGVDGGRLMLLTLVSGIRLSDGEYNAEKRRPVSEAERKVRWNYPTDRISISFRMLSTEVLTEDQIKNFIRQNIPEEKLVYQRPPTV